MKFDLKKFLKKIKLNEDNISMVFGALIVVIIGILVVNYFNDKKGEITTATNTEKSNEAKAQYEVKKGDTLWKIAEEKTGSGFKWEEIKKENGLNTDAIEVGQKLTIPDTSIVTKTETEKITTDTYTVVKGDNLWDIAVLAYGDGFRWSDIAKANNLVNPNLIHTGNVLKLPR